MKRSALSQAGAKKSLSLLLMVVMALNVFAFPVMASNDVAYIFKSKAAVDDNIVDVFEGMGLNVHLVDEKNIPSDLSGFRFVFLGDERFRNEEDIRVWEYPTIISNYFYGEEWGVTNSDGASKLASNSPLSVKLGTQIVDVYTQATIGGIGIPYYYLDGENKASGLMSVAETYTTKNDLVGDVVAYGAPGLELANGEIAEHNICYFGIIESDYWTGDALELFEECVDFVGVSCETNTDCIDQPLGGPYCVGNQVYQNINEFSCIDGGTVNSECVGEPVQVLLESCSNSCVAGSCVCLDQDNDGFDECAFGTDGDDGNNLDCNDNNSNVNPGRAEVCGDNLDNNCNGQVDEQCPLDNDNDGFDNANPGTPGDDGLPLDCNDNAFTINPGADEVCDFIDNNCNGVVDEGCSVDNDGDGYDNTNPGMPGDDGRPVDCNDNDEEVNPGEFEVCDGKDNDCDGVIDEGSNICGFGDVCSLGSCTAVTCNSDSECGSDGFFDGRFCGVDGVYQNYIEYTCENAGSISSSCTSDVDARLITSCSDTCQEGSCVTIGCDNDSECNDNNDLTEDSCVNAGTIESYCINEDIECNTNSDCDDGNDYTADSCENPGSIDSQCVYDDIVCLEDFDCGIDGFVNGLSCMGDDVSQDYRTFTCENAGTISASCTQTVESQVVTECSGTCSSGSCVTVTCNDDADCDDGNPETTESCLNPGSIDSQCTYEDVLCLSDANCGSDRYTGELFCGGKSIFRNFVDYSCNAPGSQASFCSNNIDAVEVYECTYACNEGSCLRCNTQSDCDDNDDGTVDICRFGGTIDSYCSHDVVSCFEDDDCGADSFTGAPFCLEGNVYQNFRDLSCSNAGTSGSFCDADLEAELVESCDFGCSAGSCQEEKECSNGDDDDDDGLTDAQDPGCWDDPSEPATYNPELDDEGLYDVECNVDADCGIVDYLYPPFCEGNDVIDRQDVYVCNNPGTGVSSCNLDTVTEVLDTCTAGEICLVDSCVMDCVDEDNDGFDTCNPGEPDDDGEQLDCNDNNNQVSPGATEMCNGIDDNCNGQIDEGCPVDFDGDGFDNASPGEFGDDGKELDCVDNNFDINPDALEICDGIDNNCDGIVDEANDICGVGGVCSFGSCSNTECADLIDNEPDGLTDAQDPGCWDDQNDPSTYNPNLDDEGVGTIQCTFDSDCVVTTPVSDNYCSGNDVVYDNPVPICNNAGTGLSMCDSTTEQVVVDSCSSSEVCLVDSCVDECEDIDGDGYDDCSVGEPDDDGEDLDCDDSEFSVNPGATEMCNGIDDDCDGVVDEGDDEQLCGAGNMCIAGECVSFECSNGGDDDDDNLVDAEDPGCWDDPLDPSTYNPNLDDEGLYDVECNVDADCGLSGNSGDLFCDNGDVSQDFIDYTCENPGTGLASCDVDTSVDVIDECENSEVCLENNNNAMCELDCLDEDNDGYDTCDNTKPDDDGEDAVDCNDNNANINPGAAEICNGIDDNCNGVVDEGATANSCNSNEICEAGMCEVVECNDDGDCGDDGFAGDNFCSGDDTVVRNYETFTCNNPGTSSSSCTSGLEEVEIQQCASGTLCSGGQCLDVACNQNSDCGNDGFIGDNFCSGNNVAGNYQTFTCNNPGTVASSCTSSTAPQTVEACASGFECTDAQCTEICVELPSVLNVPYTEDRSFIQDMRLIDWNIYRCYERFFTAPSGETHCAGLALKYYDSGASATELCRLKGYSSATITSSGTWSSPHDNTIAYFEGGVWKTQSGSAGGNRHIDTIRCTNPIQQCTNTNGDGPSDNEQCDPTTGIFTIPFEEFDALDGSANNFLRGGNHAFIDWTRCDNQITDARVDNGGIRINFINPPRPGDLRLTIHKTRSGNHRVAFADNINFVGPRGTPPNLNRHEDYVFDCNFDGSRYSCRWL